VNGETYKLVCECGAEIEIPCDGPHVCPRCKQVLIIAWREAIQEFQPSSPHNPRSATLATPKITQGGTSGSGRECSETFVCGYA
jgi:hypothetical protein